MSIKIGGENDIHRKYRRSNRIKFIIGGASWRKLDYSSNYWYNDSSQTIKDTLGI